MFGGICCAFPPLYERLVVKSRELFFSTDITIFLH